MMFVSYAQNFEDVLLWRALKDVEEGFYIDVGAWEPDRDSVTRAFSERGWRGINVEPVEIYHAMLERRRPRDVNLRLAVGAAPGTVTFYHIHGTGLSTTDQGLAQSNEARGFTFTASEVETLTLGEICRRHAPDVIHFLKLDCEGAEHDALAGADFTRFRPWIVLAEATVPNSSQPNHEQWEGLLLAAEYRFAWFDGLNRFYVAAEHFERLAPLLALPPNVFDKFQLASVAPAPAAAVVTATDALAAATPAVRSVDERIALAQRCRDCDDIPKAADAGRTQTEPDGTSVQIMHNGLKVLQDGYCGPWMTRLIALCHGHHEPQEERLFHAVEPLLPANASMLELGANWAYYSAWFLHGAPGRRAVLLEPDPANRAVGETNLHLNHLSARILAGLAGEHEAEAQPFETERSGTLLLPCYSVPQILAQEGIEVLDLLHCDTQGAELAVLTGARALLETGRIRWVFVSTHAHSISGDPLIHQRCLNLLRDCGGVIEAEHTAQESFSGDGLIVARFGAAPAGWRSVRISIARQSETLFRDLAYDLAEALPRERAMAETLPRIVEEVYQGLLLRKPDPDGLAHHVAHLAATRDPRHLLQTVLRGAEFAALRPRFEAEYFAAAAPGKVLPRLPPDSPVTCTGLHLRLDRDGPLGRAGETLLVPTDQVIMPAILAAGAWDVQQIDFLRQRIDPARVYTLVDIGANIGLFSRQVLNAFDNISHLHCCEPDRDNFEALSVNLRGRQGVEIHTYPVGLGDQEGWIKFFRDDENCGNYSLHADAMRGRPFSERSVEILAAGPWLTKTLADAQAILWKSDTQGNDETVVAAAPWEVWRRVEVAIIELWRIRKPLPTSAEFLDRVADMPNRLIGSTPASVADVAAYLDAEDWVHDDLYLWR